MFFNEKVCVFLFYSEIAEKVSTNTSVLERDADKKDICPSLIPGSCREKKCDRHHRPLPYLWQIRIFGTWVSFNDKENEKLERGYCNLEEIGDAEVTDIVTEMISFEIFISNFVSVVCMFCHSL